MKNKAIYCSGRANSLLNHCKEELKQHSHSIKFVVYDGDYQEVYEELCSLGLTVYQFNKNSPNRDVSLKFSLDLSNYILVQCQKYSIDYLICLGSAILKGDLLTYYKNRIINIHPSLLPSFKGLRAIDQALETNVKVLGMTAHFIDEGVDTGPIIMQGIIYRHHYKDYDSVLKLLHPILNKLFYFIDNEFLVTENNEPKFKMEPEELLIID